MHFEDGRRRTGNNTRFGYGLGFWVGEYNNKYYITQTMSKKQTEEEIIADKEMEFRKLWIDIEDETAGWVDKEPRKK